MSRGAPIVAPTGTVALAFSDIQGSTSLWERHPSAMRTALDLHNALLRETIAATRGYEVKTEGDAFMVAFGDPVDAARFALEAQTGLLGLDWPAEILRSDAGAVELGPDGAPIFRGLRIRIGVHVGAPDCRTDPTTGRMDYFGPVVNRAARVASSAHGGQIVLSDRAAAAVRPALPSLGDPPLVDLGDHRLKDLESTERIHQLLPRALAGRTFAALRTLDVRKTNLQPHPTTFVGRDRDLEALRALFGRTRLVTVMGPGGTGKSRLAARYAAVELDAFTRDGGGGSWFCDLTEARNAEGVCAAVAKSLDVPLTAGKTAADLAEQLGHAIAGHERILLVLDNFEQVAADAPATVARWLTLAPKASFLVTSQERLRLPGEEIHELAPLSVPADGAAGDPASSEAVALFLSRAAAVRRDYQPSEQDLAAIVEIVRALDGIPLAIELAAARIGVLSAAKILERLPRRFDLLGGARRDVTARQATLRGAIDWSWNLLQPWEKDALAQASVFHGGFSLESAESVLDLSAHDGAPWPLDVVQSLRDKSLLRAVVPPEFPDELRFNMYSNIREYAAEKLALSGRAPAILERHAAWFLQQGAEWASGVESKGGVERLKRLALERENLVSIFRDHAYRDPPTRESAQRSVEALRVLDPLLSARGPLPVYLEWLDAAYGSAKTVGLPLTRVLEMRGRARRPRGMNEEALADFQQAASFAKDSGDPAFLARILGQIGSMKAVLGRKDEARADFERALAMAGDARGRAAILLWKGALEMETGAHEAARASFEEALGLQRQLGNRRGEAQADANLGILLHRAGRIDDARASYEQALQIYREFGERSFEGNTLGRLAGLALEQDRVDEAISLLNEALRIHAEVGNRRSQAVFLGNLGIARQLRGDLREAAALYKRAGDLCGEVGLVRVAPLWSAYAATATALGGAGGQARADVARATEKLESLGEEAFSAAARVLAAAVDVAAAKAEPPATAQPLLLRAAMVRSGATGEEDVRLACKIYDRIAG